MFSLTEDHFETFHCRASADNLRKPFIERLDLIRQFHGDVPHENALEILDRELNEYGEPGDVLWRDTPEANLEMFNKILEMVK